MNEIMLGFIILNAFLLGLGLAGIPYLRSSTRQIRDLKGETAKIRDECLSLTKTMSEAHNGMAKKLLDVDDKLKAMELRTAAAKMGMAGQHR